MKTLKFTTNWNNKLNCKSFLAIRLYNPSLYYQYAEFMVELKKGDNYEKIGIFKIESIAIGMISELHDWQCLLDSGYCMDEWIKIVRNIYKNKPIDIYNEKFCLMVLSRQSI